MTKTGRRSGRPSELTEHRTSTWESAVRFPRYPQPALHPYPDKGSETLRKYSSYPECPGCTGCVSVQRGTFCISFRQPRYFSVPSRTDNENYVSPVSMSICQIGSKHNTKKPHKHFLSLFQSKRPPGFLSPKCINLFYKYIVLLSLEETQWS